MLVLETCDISAVKAFIMETQIRLQLDISERIGKALINFKKSPKERTTIPYVETRLESLEQLWDKFSTVHQNLIENYTTEALAKSTYTLNNVYDTTEDKYLNCKCELKVALNSLTGLVITDAAKSQSSASSSKLSQIKLPKITIPMFSGEYTEWMSFRDLFVSLIHQNKDIDKVQKLHYLKGHLKGEAEQLLRHIPITNDSYDQCWTLLESRYNNKQYLINRILNRFFAQKNVVAESASAIKELLDVTSETLNALISLGIDTSSWDVIIIYIVSQRLDPDTRKQWESKVSELVTLSDQLPSIDQFKEFLATKYHSLEFLDTKPHTASGLRQRTFTPNVRNNKVNPIHMLHITQMSCICCKREHHLRSCKEFAIMDLSSKRNFVQNHGLCFNCLGSNHSVKHCRNATSCQLCNRRHHSLLHPKGEMQSTEVVKSVDVQVSPTGNNSFRTSSEEARPSTSTTIANHFVKGVAHQVLLATAVVKAESRDGGGNQLLRALIDQGSQASFITKAAVRLLGLKQMATKGIISGLGGENTMISKSMVEVQIISRLNPGCTLRVSAYVLDKLTAYLPATKASITSWPELKGIPLADPEFHDPNKIDILLGAEVYSVIIESGIIKCPSGSLVAQNTTLGWILSGQIESAETATPSSFVASLHTQMEPVDEMIRSFWEIEAEPCNKQKIMTPEEQRCENIYESTTTRDAEGRYVVKLPFRDEQPACADGQSREIALKRFHYLEKKLEKDIKLKQEYSKVFREYLELNHMQKIVRDAKEKAPKGLYLPYHAVIREDKETTKVRVVFDASCKGVNGVSLNSDLMVGPTLQPELRHIIMRWRMHPICFIADITKMYRQIKVRDEDSEYQRILWREHPSEDIQEYKLLRVTFGTSSAPYLAVKSLIQAAKDEGHQYPLAAERIKQEFYMDDLMSGCEEEHEAIEIYRQITELLGKAGFELQKWSSNCDSMLDQIRERTVEAERDKRIEVKQDSVNKILGLTWSRENDEFLYGVQLPPISEPVTKRKVVSDISKLYDPQGWIAPSVIKAKIFIQRLWLAGVDWDETLSSPLLEEWLEYRSSLSDLTQFRLPRWMMSKKNSRSTELHGFCDASNSAYAAVVYLRVIDLEGNIHVSLVTAKTRVAPIKQISVPRLELSGAVLLAKLLREVSEVLDVPNERMHAWTDSEIVLAWLSSHPSRWKTFIGNRTSEILTITGRHQWAHVQSQQNPADCASRGIPPAELIFHHLWKNGPVWLKEEKITYTNPKNLETKLEERKIETYLAGATLNVENEDDRLWSKYSSLTKLLRVVAYCRRILKSKHKPHTYLLKSEINEALVIMLKKCQRQSFEGEIHATKTGTLQRKSQLTSLNPQIDEAGILRVGGRLEFADITFDQKHPILLPKSSWLTTLIIQDAHVRTLHGGVPLMINFLRSKYWIFGMRNLVKGCIRKCITCVRHASSKRNPLMGQLPSSRVEIARAFLRSGVDYAGPINIRVSKGRGNKSYKGYICLFICMATRAVHLEAVSELSTQGFLAAFKRFIARRGHCSDIYSDNGTNFVGASKELKQLFLSEKALLLPELADWMANNGTEWHFIPPYAPNFGGLWESAIKSCKFHLKRVIGNSTLTFEEMTTVLSQIEACLNSRPISCIDDQGDRLPLTPGHFLVGEPLIVAPDHQYDHSPVSSLRRWQYCQRMLQDFWKRWSQEYLTQFLQRHKWRQQIPEPKIGDVVLVKELDLPPARWLLGKVVATHPGLDKVTRVVTLQCKNSLIKRPVSKLCVLPINE